MAADSSNTVTAARKPGVVGIGTKIAISLYKEWEKSKQSAKKDEETAAELRRKAEEERAEFENNTKQEIEKLRLAIQLSLLMRNTPLEHSSLVIEKVLQKKTEVLPAATEEDKSGGAATPTEVGKSGLAREEAKDDVL